VGCQPKLCTAPQQPQYTFATSPFACALAAGINASSGHGLASYHPAFASTVLMCISVSVSHPLDPHSHIRGIEGRGAPGLEPQRPDAQNALRARSQVHTGDGVVLLSAIGNGCVGWAVWYLGRTRPRGPPCIKPLLCPPCLLTAGHGEVDD
jgi:hypothetical protein